MDRRCSGANSPGGYRRRLEAELRDHLESQCRALMEAGRTEDGARAEAVRLMGEPEQLQAEYLAAWRRSLPGRLRQLGAVADVWLTSLIMMTAVNVIGWPAARVLSDSLGCLIAGFLENTGIPWDIAYRCSVIITVLPASTSLVVGADYLRREFQARAKPVWLVSVPLFVQWALSTLIGTWLYASFDAWHMGYAEYLWRIRALYLPGLAVCIVLGQLCGRRPGRTKAAA